jgi:hypothetical protein
MFIGPLVTLVAPGVRLVMISAVVVALMFSLDALVVGDPGAIEPSKHWRTAMYVLCSLSLSCAARTAGAGIGLLFVLSMAEAHHGLPLAAEAAIRLELGIAAFSLLVCSSFAVLGGAGRRSISEEALRSQAMRQQAAFLLMLDEKDAELTRLRVELAASRKINITRADSLRTLRQQASTQSAELVKLMAQSLEVQDDDLPSEDTSSEALARKKDS